MCNLQDVCSDRIEGCELTCKVDPPGCEEECSHPEHKQLDKLLDPADAMQAFIDGIKAKMETSLINKGDAMVLALGRCATIMMEHTAELALMAGDEQASALSRHNAGALMVIYKALADTMLDDIAIHMNRTRVIAATQGTRIVGLR